MWNHVRNGDIVERQTIEVSHQTSRSLPATSAAPPSSPATSLQIAVVKLFLRWQLWRGIIIGGGGGGGGSGGGAAVDDLGSRARGGGADDRTSGMGAARRRYKRRRTACVGATSSRETLEGKTLRHHDMSSNSCMASLLKLCIWKPVPHCQLVQIPPL